MAPVCLDQADDGTIENGYSAGTGESWREFCLEIETTGCSSTTQFVELANAAFGFTRTGAAVNIDYTLLIREGGPSPGDPPGSILTSLAASVIGVPTFPGYAATPVPIPTPVSFPVGDRGYACIVLGPPTEIYVGVDQSPGTPLRPTWTRSDLAPAWDPVNLANPDHRSLVVRVAFIEGRLVIFVDGFESGTTAAWGP